MSTPLFFADPLPFNRVRIAGILVLAVAVKMNGLFIEGEWKMHRSLESNGAIFAFQGMNPVGGESGFSITFRITSRDEEAQLVELWNALKPVPVRVPARAVVSDVAAPVTSTPSAEEVLADLKKSLAALNSPQPATGSGADVSFSTRFPQRNPGPRPPTVPIELGWLAFLGCFAGAMKRWSFDDFDVESHADRFDVTITFVHNSPPRNAGTGAMSAPKTTTPGTGTATVVTPASTMQRNAVAGASGV